MSATTMSTDAGSPLQPTRSCDEIKSWISTEVARILEIDVADVDPDQEFSTFGVDSLVAFSMTGELCEWLGQDLPATLLWEYPTISSLAEHIVERFAVGSAEESSASNSVLLSHGDKQDRLFAVCGIELYQSLADQMSDTLDTYGVYVAPEKSLGKFGKQIDDRYKYVTVEDLAASYVDEIVAVDPHGPYNLLGLSFGGVLAFEAARQLQSRGADVPLVVLLDSVLPAAVRVRAYRHALSLIKSVVSRTDVRAIASEDETEALTYEEMVRYRGRYYWTLGKRYDPSPYSGSVLLVRATATRLFGKGYIHDDQLGWRDLVTGSLDTIRLNATHTGLLQYPHVTELSELLSATLESQCAAMA